MGWVERRSKGWRGVCLALAALALAIKVLIPQGFMVANQGGAFPLVICTGHGPAAERDDGKKGPAQKYSDAPCAFAGNITPPPPSAAAIPAEPYAAVAERLADDRAADLMPGRGLAAPPPQSHAPPSVSI